MSVFRAIRAALTVLMLPEGRRAWALVLLAGGGATMTVYAAVALWFVKSVPSYVLYLGLAAHFTILIVITGFAGLLVKRSIVAEFGTGRRLAFQDQADPAVEAPDRVAGAADLASELAKEERT